MRWMVLWFVAQCLHSRSRRKSWAVSIPGRSQCQLWTHSPKGFPRPHSDSTWMQVSVPCPQNCPPHSHRFLGEFEIGLLTVLGFLHNYRNIPRNAFVGIKPILFQMKMRAETPHIHGGLFGQVKYVLTVDIWQTFREIEVYYIVVLDIYQAWHFFHDTFHSSRKNLISHWSCRFTNFNVYILFS